MADGWLGTPNFIISGFGTITSLGVLASMPRQHPSDDPIESSDGNRW